MPAPLAGAAGSQTESPLLLALRAPESASEFLGSPQREQGLANGSPQREQGLANGSPQREQGERLSVLPAPLAGAAGSQTESPLLLALRAPESASEFLGSPQREQGLANGSPQREQGERLSVLPAPLAGAAGSQTESPLLLALRAPESASEFLGSPQREQGLANGSPQREQGERLSVLPAPLAGAAGSQTESPLLLALRAPEFTPNLEATRHNVSKFLTFAT